MSRWTILQPYYVYAKLAEGSYTCTLYLPNNAATRMVIMESLSDDAQGLAKDEARRV